MLGRVFIWWVFFGCYQIVISMVGSKRELSHIDGPGSNSHSLVEHHYDVNMVWHLLREKPRQD